MEVNDPDHVGLGDPDLYVDSATHNHILSELDHRRTLEMERQCSSNDQRKELDLMNKGIYLPGRPGKCAGRTIEEYTERGTEAEYDLVTFLDSSYPTTDPRPIDITVPHYTPRLSEPL